MADTITVTWGEENFMPYAYNGYRVGPLSITTEIRPNETYHQAYKRVWDELELIGREMFLQKRNGWAERYLARK